ncbi:MAG: peptidoglycan DD-metalloendopeptidase family protein [Pseudomonadota bacterium]
MAGKWKHWSIAALAIVLVACSHSTRAPITDKAVTKSPAVERSIRKPKPSKQNAPRVYAVVKGDTLQAIAWRFGLNHHDIARWNRLKNANLIFVGQKLRLTPPKTKKQGERTSRNKKVTQAKKSPQTTKPLNWRWPAIGKVTAATSALGTKGIEITGKRGSKIIAAEAGKVVYSGDGLRGYGNLLIIQHNDLFLSAYAHNEKILVSEGINVKAGQPIATMGNSGTKQVMLHFEIRRNGKAVEPTNYLPRR